MASPCSLTALILAYKKRPRFHDLEVIARDHFTPIAQEALDKLPAPATAELLEIGIIRCIAAIDTWKPTTPLGPHLTRAACHGMEQYIRQQSTPAPRIPQAYAAYY